LTYAKYGIYVANCVIRHEEYVGQTRNKFSNRYGHCTAVIGTNLIAKMTMTKWSYCSTIFSVPCHRT